MIPTAQMHGDERGARLDKPPGQQRRLTPRVPAVTLSGLRMLAIDAEGVASLFARHELVRLAIKLVERRKLPTRSTARGTLSRCRISERRSSSRLRLKPGTRSRFCTRNVSPFRSPPRLKRIVLRPPSQLPPKYPGTRPMLAAIGTGGRRPACRRRVRLRGSRAMIEPISEGKRPDWFAFDPHLLARQHAMAALRSGHQCRGKASRRSKTCRQSGPGGGTWFEISKPGTFVRIGRQMPANFGGRLQASDRRDRGGSGRRRARSKSCDFSHGRAAAAPRHARRREGFGPQDVAPVPGLPSRPRPAGQKLQTAQAIAITHGSGYRHQCGGTFGPIPQERKGLRQASSAGCSAVLLFSGLRFSGVRFGGGQACGLGGVVWTVRF